LTRQAENVIVQIKYKDVEKTFSGNPEEVWLLMNKFFNQFLPSFEIANKLVLNVDLQKLTKDCENIIAFAPEGPYLLVPRNKLTDNETLSLLLLANYIGCQLGKIEKDCVSKEELQTKLGKDAKIASTRLGELVKNGIAAKTSDEKYRITTFGLVQMQKDVLPKIKAKISS
jgi:hypothetical protein